MTSSRRFAGNFVRCGLMLLLMAAGAVVVRAQDVVGSWQGTVTPPTGRPMRVVVKVTKKDDGALKGTMAFMDRAAEDLPLILKYTAPDFSFSVGGMEYHGKVAADDKTVAGIWTIPTGPNGATVPVPVTLEHTTPETAWTYSGPKDPPPMDPKADPSFEVATIKLSPPDAKGGIQYNLGRREFRAANCTAGELIKIAYFVRGRQVEGGPKWLREQKYDVVAQTDTDIPGQPSEAQTRIMVRKLLEQRFGLKVHMIKRDFSVYAMVVEKPSPKLSKSEDQVKPMMLIGGPTAEDGQMTMQFEHATMAEFAALMMNFIQTHQIVDATGLQGKYDFSVAIQRSAFQTPTGADDLPDPAFVQAIQPLGLKFVVKKEPLDVVVVDEINLPSEN